MSQYIIVSANHLPLLEDCSSFITVVCGSSFSPVNDDHASKDQHHQELKLDPGSVKSNRGRISMKIAGKAVRALIGLGLGAGLFYASSALRSKSVYASSACTQDQCVVDQGEAEDFCQLTYSDPTLSLFQCPVTPTSNIFEWKCAFDPTHTLQFDNCTDD